MYRSLTLGEDLQFKIIDTLPRGLTNAVEVVIEVHHCFLDERVIECMKLEKSRWPVGSFPHLVGWEVCGKVIKVGAHVTRCKVGDMVVALLSEPEGGCTKQVTAPESSVIIKPYSLSMPAAVASIKSGILAFDAIYYRLQVVEGDTVLITDVDSNFGSLVVQMATNIGAFVVLLAQNSAELKKLEAKYGCATCKVIIAPKYPATDSKGRFLSDKRSEDGINDHGVKKEIKSDDSDDEDSEDDKSDNKNDKQLKEWSENVLDLLMTETDGLGFDHVIDSKYYKIHKEPNDDDVNMDNLLKKNQAEKSVWQSILIKCLGAHASFVTLDFDLEIDSSESLQLAIRGSVIGYLSEYPWLLSTTRRTKLLHILEDLLENLDNKKYDIEVPPVLALEQAVLKLPSYLKNMKSARIGAVVSFK